MDPSWESLVRLGVVLLGQATISRQSRQKFTVRDIGGGAYHVVERQGLFHCTTCREGLAEQDRHAAVILLFVLATENGPGWGP